MKFIRKAGGWPFYLYQDDDETFWDFRWGAPRWVYIVYGSKVEPVDNSDLFLITDPTPLHEGGFDFPNNKARELFDSDIDAFLCMIILRSP